MSTGRTGDRGTPETMAQARRWDAVKNLYLRGGACPACASQAAWGHQLGWSTVRPPCGECAEISASWPWDVARRTTGFSPARENPDGAAA